MDTNLPDTAAAQPASAARAGRREWIGLAVLALPTMALATDMSVLYLALPHLSADLAPSGAQQLWILDIYGFFIAGFLVTMGTLGDRIGRRRLLMMGAAAFGVASVVAAHSTSAEMLLVVRALLGIAGATLMPSTLALISNMFKNPAQRSVAIAVWMSSFMGGMAVGPVVGGVLLEWFWWGSVFLLNVPPIVVLLAAAPVLLPEYRDPKPGRLDLTSVALSLATILPVIYGLKELAKDGPQPGSIGAILAGAAVGVVFVRRQLRLDDPLVDVRLFSNRTFSTAIGLFVMTGTMLGGVMLFVTQYLQMIAELSPLQAGLWLLPSALATVAGAMAAPAITRRVGPGYVFAAGLVTAAAGLTVLTQVDSSGGMALLLGGYVVAALGMGPTAALGTDLVVGSAPPERAGSAASMSETSAEFGFAFGVAAMGSIGLAVYRSRITSNLPSDTPADVVAATRDTLANAVVSAERLPAGAATDVLGAARDAFTSGLNTIAAIGAVALAALAFVAFRTLRHVPPAGASNADADPVGVDVPVVCGTVAAGD